MSVVNKGRQALFYLLWGGLFWLGMAVRLAGLYHTDPTLTLGAPLWDDSFYYFSLGRNLAEGQGFRVDSQHFTTGFQPLWGVLVALPYLFSPTDAQGDVHAVQALGLLVGAGTFALIYDLTRRLTASKWAGLLNAGLWWLAPQSALHNLSGMETSLALMMQAGVLWALHRVYQGQEGPAWGLLGVLSGLCLLARVDSALLLAALALGVLAFPPPLAEGLTRRRAWGQFARFAALPLLPWLLLTLSLGKSPLPESGSAVRTQVAYISEPSARPPALTWAAWQTPNPTFGEEYNYYRRNLSLWTRTVTESLYIFAPLRALGLPLDEKAVSVLRYHTLYAGAALLWAGLGAFWMGRLGRVLILGLGLWALGMTLAYSFVVYIIWFYPRYALPLAETLAWVGMAGLLSFLVRWPRLCAGLALLLSLGAGVAYAEAYRHDASYQWILDPTFDLPDDGFYRAAQWLNANLGPQERVGALQSGALAYYSRVPVINLDGKVNAEARAALAEGRMWDYLCRAELSYVVDWPIWVFYLIMERSGGWQSDYMRRAILLETDYINPVEIYRVNQEACR